MYTICVAALKGGVGKTTTATNIAYLLSKSNRVLFADAGCQGVRQKCLERILHRLAAWQS